MTKNQTQKKSPTLMRMACCLLMLLGLWTTNVNAQVYYTIGTSGGTNTSSTYPCPLQDYYEGSRQQFLYRASDLTAMGMSAGTITHLRWNITALNAAGLIEGFTIKIGATASTALLQTAGTWETSPTTCFGPVGYTPLVGLNTFDITDFVWNGTSNIVIDICNGQIPANAATWYTNNPSIAYQVMSYNASRTYRADDLTVSACGTTVAATATQNPTRRPLIDFGMPPPPPCTGTPAPGNTTSTVNPACSGSPFTLGLQNVTPGTGVTYQWQSSPDNATWTNFGAGASTQVTSQVSATYYRALVTCAGNTGTSNSLQVTMGGNCQCLVYCNSAFTNVTYEFITNVTYAGINNTSGATVGGPVNYTGFTGTVNAGSPATLSVTIDPDALDYVYAWVDWNQNGLFTDVGEQYTVVASTGVAGPHTLSITPPVSALGGSTRLRVMVDYNNAVPNPCRSATYGEAEDYCLTVIPAVPCSGTPAPGNTLSTLSSVCSGQNFTLSLQNATTGVGVTYQWQSSPDDITYSNIGGATNSTLTTNQVAATYYRCEVTCSAGPSIGISTPIQVTMGDFAQCGPYCNPIMFPSNPCSYINSTTTSGGVANITPATDAGFNSNIAPGVSFFNQTVSQAQGSPFTLTVQAAGTCNIAYYSVWVDWDQSGVFDAGELMVNNVSSGNALTNFNISVPLGATLGSTRMRIIDWTNGAAPGVCADLSGFYGETEDFRVTVLPAVACSGTPAPGNTLSTANTVCSGENFTLSYQNVITGTGVSYQWQTSPDNATWSNAGGASTGTTYATSQVVATYYRAEVTCSTGPASGYSNSLQVTMNPASQCYCRGTYSNYTCDVNSQDFITNFSLNTLSNNTGTTCPATGNTGAPFQNWSFFPNTTTLNKGATYVASISVGSGGAQGVGIWIDYNQNGNWNDAGEFVGTTSTIAASSTGTLNVSVPAGALIGNTTMRVKTIWNLNPMTQASVCALGGYGEQEDYEITIACDASSTAPTGITSDDADNEICNGGSVMLTQTGGALGTLATYQWYTGSCGGTSVGSGPSISVSPSSTTTYYVRAESCSGAPTICASVTITVSSVPVTVNVPNPPITGLPAAACNGTSSGMSTVAVPNATQYIWDAPAGSVINAVSNPYTTNVPNATIVFGNPNGSGYYIGVQASNACGSSLRRTVWVRGTVGVPAAVSPDNGRTIECPNTVAYYTVGTTVGATNYLWSTTGVDMTITAGQGSHNVEVTFGPGFTSGTLCVAAQTSCYTSANKCITITSAAPTIGIMSGPNTACIGDVFAYSVPAQAGIASYSWTLPPGASGTSSTNSINITFGPGFIGGNISVTSTTICGNTSAPRVRSVNWGAASVPASITGVTSGLCGQTVIYTCPFQAGATFNWTVPQGTINSGQGSNSISVTFGTFTGSSTVCVTASNACGASAARCITVTGRPNVPGAITATPASWCANTSGIQFDVNVTGLSGSYTLSWLYPGPTVATYVIGGGNSTQLVLDWITGSGPVNVTASNACGNQTRNSSWSDVCREGEEVVVSNTSSSLMVYPNPTSGNVNIQFSSMAKGNAQMTVVDITGRTVVSQNISIVEGLNNTQLDLSKAAKGIYMLNVNSAEGTSKVKIVVE